MRIKLLTGCCAVALSVMAAGCADSTNTANTNTAVTNTATTTTTNSTNTAMTNSTQASDSGDSEVSEMTDASGAKVQTRTFKNNSRISKVVVTTTKEGKRTTRVYPSSRSRFFCEPSSC